MTAASKEKGKTVEDEQWPELSKHGGTGYGKLELNGEDGKKPWTNLFATNRLVTRGMNLKYIPPVIVDGEKVVEILPEDVAQDDEKWASSIVVNVVGTTPSIEAMEREGHGAMLRASSLVEKSCYNETMDSGVQFQGGDTHYHSTMVKLPNLPLNCWNSVVLSKIGCSLGKPLYADECTTQTSRISFARILVEVDVTRPLAKVIKMKDPKGRIVEQKVWYEWKPMFCQKCLQVGHSCVDKPTTTMQVQKKGQGQGQRKEWIPTTNKEQGIGKVQVEDNQQEKLDHEKDEIPRDKENGRQLDIELLSEENLGTVKIQEKDRNLNLG
ncbi:hypothetical protein KY284_007715 [Solanum tuberosum]|nr:hypothetical protein KY284_007715 [Solanum tuberosum]